MSRHVPYPVAAVASVLVLAALLFMSVPRLDSAMRSALGIHTVAAAPLPRNSTVTISAGTRTLHPAVVVAATGGNVTFVNGSDSIALIRTASLSPARFTLRLPARARATVHLDRPGLYHYYDAVTSHPLRVIAWNEVIVRKGSGGAPVEGWIAVLAGVPGARDRLLIPAGQDLFQPKVETTVVGRAVLVTNRDSDAHNFVIDPASPAGGAFIISGTDAEPPHGWQRTLVVQAPGLYHVYCTMHTRVVGKKDGWNVVAPRRSASGYRYNDPMEAWIVALPATTRR